MAGGQAVLSPILDVGAVNAVEARLADREAGRHATHAAMLRDALELERLYEAAGMGSGAPAQLALVLGCSETRAVAQLTEAGLLVELPGALQLRACWVDPDGVPVSMSEGVERPPRGDHEAVRRSLRRLVDAPRGARQPRHPDDHDPPDLPHPSGAPDGPGPPPGPGPSRPPGSAGPPGSSALPGVPGPPDPVVRPDPADVADAVDVADPADAPDPAEPLARPRLLSRQHPTGQAGPYRVPARLHRFLRVRAPRCEWPGCGARASRCDDEHDLPHPDGPTCACNCGPLCRRHHRVKQLGWAKHRTELGLFWTLPAGGWVRSPDQHLPVPPVRRSRPAAEVDPFVGLSPSQVEQERWTVDPTDPVFQGLDADPDLDTDDHPGPATRGRWHRQDRDREQRWWASELAALRREVHHTPHD